jgi:guanine nucleotide-exchange factor
LRLFLGIYFTSWFQVSVSSASSVVKDTPSSSTKDSENGEISTDSQDEEKVTLGDALSMNRASEAPPTSVEELQNLAGGADIKVVKLDRLLL